MTLASHYVLKDILNSLDDEKEAKEIFDKFCKRYREDMELAEACKEFKKYLKSKDPKSLEKIKKKLGELIDGRGIETGGGERLWYNDRRPGRSD